MACGNDQVYTVRWAQAMNLVSLANLSITSKGGIGVKSFTAVKTSQLCS